MQNNTELKQFIPKPNNWFSPSVSYEGLGTAYFSSPNGWVSGPTQARFDENGDVTIVMKVENCSHNDMPLGAFLNQGKKIDGGGYSWGIGGPQNPCHTLVINSEKGRFVTFNPIFHENTNSLTQEATIRFTSLKYYYAPTSPLKPKYWVLPLLNYTGMPTYKHPSLDRHPLRIFPTPIIPDKLPKKDLMMAGLLANNKNHLIIFNFDKKLAFIEKLGEHKERIAKLKSGTANLLVTALMVGEIPNSGGLVGSAFIQILGDLLMLLSFCSGTPVSSPWIELRDSNGELSARIHLSFEVSSYEKGRAAIRGSIHGGIGLLLTNYLESTHVRKPYFVIATKNLIKANKPYISEDRFVHLCIALDVLASQYGFNNQDLIPLLDETLGRQVKQILRESSQAIKAAGEKLPVQKKDILDKISNRIMNSGGRVSEFGISITNLLNEFQLPDGDIMNRYFEENKHKSYGRILSEYRGECVHKGYIEKVNSKLELMEFTFLTLHLQDVLTRIILKILEYGGTYQPTVLSGPTKAELDWVKEDFTIQQLGFDERFQD